MGIISEFFGAILAPIMRYGYMFLKDYGFALLLFTIITKVILFPLSIKQQKNSVKLAMFQPKLQQIQKQYANNKEKMQEETMKLYEKEKFNPMSGCLPMLIQFPILFGLIEVVYKPLTYILKFGKEAIATATSIAENLPTYQAANKVFIQNDIIRAVKENAAAFEGIEGFNVAQILDFNYTFFGIDMTINPDLGLNPYIIIPILSALTSLASIWISTKLSSSLSQNSQGGGAMKGMLLFMPLFSLWIGFQYPVGVGLYWIFSNVLVAVQSLILNKIWNPKKMLEEAKAKEEAEAQLRKQERKERAEQKKAQKEEKTEAMLNGETVSELDEEIEKATDSTSKIIAEARKRMAEKYGD